MEIKRYLKIYKKWIEFSLISDTRYRFNFVMEILIELGYIGSFFALFTVVYGHVDEIAGWNFDQVKILLGFHIIVNGFIDAAIWVYNLRLLPGKISAGAVDHGLLQPLNSMVIFTFSKFYIAGFLVLIPGVIIFLDGYKNLNPKPEAEQIAIGFLLLILGIIIEYSIQTIIVTFTFVLLNAYSLTRVAGYAGQFKMNPPGVYTSWKYVLFYFIFPVVFITGIPAQTIIEGIDYKFMGLAFIIAFICLFICVRFWNFMIRYYGSASS